MVRRRGFGPIECAIDRSLARRKRRGLFFTPWPIARRLAETLVSELPPPTGPEPPRLCDPFAGVGVLLAALVETLIPWWQSAHPGDEGAARRHLLGGAHGCDIDAEALALCGRSLSGGDPALARQLAGRLVQADALLTPVAPPPAQVTGPPTTTGWPGLFPRVFARGGFDIVITNPPWEKVRVNDREFFTQVSPGFSRLPRRERDRLRERLLQRPEVAESYRAYCSRVAQLKRTARRDFATAKSGGDLDTYKLAVERALDLARPGGLAALIVPTGLLGDWGARRVRRRLLADHDLLDVIRLETGRELFPEIHANLGVALVVIRRGRAAETEDGRARLYISQACRTLRQLARPVRLGLPRALVRSATPHAMIPLLERETDVDFLEHCLAFPRLGEWPEEHFRPAREIDMTNDRAHFGEPGTGIPLLEGKNLAPYRLAETPRRFDLAPARYRPLAAPRIAWRAVADRAMRRRLLAAWVPPDVALGNSLVYTAARGEAGGRRLLWLLAWMNSRIAEAQLRLWCANNNINIFHVRICRVPPLGESALHRRILDLAGRLLDDRAAADLGVVRPAPSADHDSTPPQRPVQTGDANHWATLVDQLDQAWRQVYGLPETTWQESVLARTASVADWLVRAARA